VDAREAIDLLATAVEPSPGIWADLGAGTGTFARALAGILTPPSHVHAIDSDRRALAEIARHRYPAGVEVSATVGDFTDPAVVSAMGDVQLNGILAANALHFVRDADVVLARWLARLTAGGRVVIIEYDRRQASRWVPYPLPPARLADIAAKLGLPEPRITATRPSAYSGILYVALIQP